MKHNYALVAGLLLLLGGGGIALGSQSKSNVSAPPAPMSATTGVSTRTSEGENPAEGSESVATYSIQVEHVYESKFFVGDTKKLTLTVTPSELAETASWWSDQPDIVSVSQDGTITCLSAGCAYIWASIKGNDFSSHADATKVYVYPAPGEVAFDQKELRLAIDSDYSEGAPGLVLMINPDEETPKGEWRIADTSIAKFLEYPDNVVACGILPVSVGTTEVTFTAENGNSATCKIIVYKTLESITPTVSDSTMMVGNTFQIEATVVPANANQPLKYESYNENVATVDSKGLVTAIAPGNTTIWLRPMYYGGVEASVNVHVVTNPDSISVSNANDFNITLGETRLINVQFTPIEFVNTNVEWTVDNPEIAEIVKSENENDDTSFVKGLAYGKTIVRGTTPNGLTTEFEVNVYGLYDGDDSFELNARDKSLNVGETFQIEIAGEDKGQTFSYSSEDESIATVDSLGLVTAVSKGETSIIVKPSMQEWFTRSMRVSVCEAPENVELTKTEYLFTEPYTQKVELTFTPDNDNVNREINWTYNPEDIVKINYDTWEKAYYIEPLNLGQTTVTGTAANGQQIEFTAKYEGLKIDNKEAHRDYTVGDEFDLTASASSPELLENAGWWSSNPDFISVDNGHVTCLRPGSSSIRISTRVNDDYYSDNIVVTSHPEAGQVGIEYHDDYNNNALLRKGKRSAFTAILPLGEENYDGEWSVEGEGVVEVLDKDDTRCTLMGLEDGTATITYTMSDGRAASLNIIVYTRIDSFDVNSDDVTLSKGKTFQIEVSNIQPEDANQRMTYFSENEEIATVDSLGLITAVGFGETRVSVKPEYQGLWHWITVHVKEGPDSVVMENKDIILNGIGFVVPLDITYTPDDENIDRTINWTYSEEGIIAIEKDYWSNGYLVRSEDFGTVTFTGEASNGQILEGTATVNGISILGDDMIYLNIGDSHQFEVKASSEDILNSLRWSTGNSAIAEVDEVGNVTAIQPGEAYLWASGSEGSNTYENSKVIIVYPEEGSIALNQPSIEMPQGYYTQLSVILPEGESIYDGVWSVSDESIIEAEYQEYKYYGFRTIATGTTTITYTMADGRSASCVVTVKGDVNDRVESITLESYQEYGKIGGEFQMQATANPDTYGRTIRYYSENPDVATVDSEGLVRYVGYGSTKISAYVDNSNGLGDYIYAQMDVMIYEEPAAVTVEEGEEITVDTPQELTPISIEFEAPEGVEPEDVCTDIVWEYSVDGIINIEKSDPTSRARIRALGTRAGETNAKTADFAIKAKDFGTVEYWGYSPYDTEKTNPLVSGIITVRGILIDADALDCFIDETASVTVRTSGDDVASNLTVNTDDQNIARLVPNSDGSYTVRGLNLGYTTLNAVSVVDGVTYSASTPVNVILNPAIADRIASINLDSRDLFLYIFDTKQLTATVLNGYGSEMTSAGVSWTSSNPEVATVAADGSITPAGYGSTIITASATDTFGNTLTASCEVYVIRYSSGGGSGGGSGVDALFGEEGTCDIYNVSGEVVKKDATKADFDNLDKGVYIVRKDNHAVKVVK